MSRANTWTNSDGLVVGFGAHTTDTGMLKYVGNGNGLDIYKMEIVGVDVIDTVAVGNLSPQAAYLPKGSYIKSATLYVTEAFTGSSSTLELGTFGTTVVDDADGIDATIALTAIDAIGDVVLCDGVLVGALLPVGRTAKEDCTVTASWGTALFTAGKATLVVEVLRPSGNQGRTLAIT